MVSAPAYRRRLTSVVRPLEGLESSRPVVGRSDLHFVVELGSSQHQYQNEIGRSVDAR